MKKLISSACCAVILLAGVASFAADGAASKAELQQLYQRYFQQKDERKLATLVYWPGVEQRDRDGFFRSLRGDLNYRLQKVEFLPLDPGLKLEYTLSGITYVPALPPVGRVVATYEGQGNVNHASTSYLVGVKDGRFYITLAVPKPK
jgi:hypothetical protein